MSAVSVKRQLPDRAAKRRGFWQGLVQPLDALAAYPTRHAASEYDLCRVDGDIGRCRQMMVKAR